MEFQSIWLAGMAYTAAGFAIISILFAIYRWGVCVTRYISTGKIDKQEGTFFFGDGNWFYGKGDSNPKFRHSSENTEPEYILRRRSNPWAVAFDIVIMSVAGALLAIGWPVTVITVAIVVYARVARDNFAKKQEFVARLEGSHV